MRGLLQDDLPGPPENRTNLQRRDPSFRVATDLRPVCHNQIICKSPFLPFSPPTTKPFSGFSGNGFVANPLALINLIVPQFLDHLVVETEDQQGWRPLTDELGVIFPVHDFHCQGAGD